MINIRTPGLFQQVLDDELETIAVFEPGQRIEVRLGNLGSLFRHHIEQVAIAVGKIDAEILARNCEQPNHLVLGIDDRADNVFVRGILFETILAGIFDMVDDERLLLRFDKRVNRVTQVIKQPVRFEQWIVVLVFMHRDVFARDEEKNNVDIEEARSIRHQLAQQFASMVNVDGLVLGLVDQVELLVTPGKLVGHMVELVFLAGERLALFVISQ